MNLVMYRPSKGHLRGTYLPDYSLAAEGRRGHVPWAPVFRGAEGAIFSA